MPAKSKKALDKRKEHAKLYQRELRAKKKAERLAAAPVEDAPSKADVIRANFKPAPLKTAEMVRMDLIVIRAFLKAVNRNNYSEAEIIKRNPENAHIDWDLIENGKEVYNLT